MEALEADRLARKKGHVNNTNYEIKHRSADDLDDRFTLETINDKEDDGENPRARKLFITNGINRLLKIPYTMNVLI